MPVAVEAAAADAEWAAFCRDAVLGMYRTTPDGRIVMANPALLRMLGFTSFDELATRNLEEGGYEPGYERSAFKAILLRDGVVTGHEAHWTRRDGTTLWVRENARLVRGPAGAEPWFEGTVEDISEHHRGDSALIASEARYRALFENMAEGVFYQVADGTIVDANPAALEMLGLERAELLGRSSLSPAWDLVDEGGAVLPGFERPSMRALLTGRAVPDTVIGVRNPMSGARRWLEVSAIPEFRAGDSSPWRALVTLRDITEHRRAAAILQSIADGTSDALFVKDRAGRYVFANRAAAAYAGRPAEEMVGRDDTAIFPADAARIMEGDRRTMEAGVTRTYEERVTTPDGEDRTFLATKGPLSAGGGVVDGLFGISRDITDRTRMEEALRQSEERYRLLFDGIGDAVFVSEVNRDGLPARIIAVNEGARRRLGYTREELLRVSIRDLNAPELPEVDRVVRDRLERGEPVLFERIYVARDGRRIPVEVNAQRFEMQGRPVILSVVRDISDRRRTEAALRESEERYRTLAEEIPAILYIDEPVGNAQSHYLSPRFTDLLGYLPEEILRDPNIYMDRVVHPEDRPRVVAQVADTLAGKRTRIEYRCIGRDGREVWVYDEAIPVLGPDGAIVAVRGYLVDITDRVHAEQELRRRDELLLQAQKMESVGRLAGGIAHDFNNMLLVILGHVELALDGLSHDDQLDASLREIQAAARHSADLTRQLLTFAGKQPIAPRDLDLNDAVVRALRLIRRLIGEDIQVVSRPDPNLWPITIDPAQVDQVLTNLCLNARDAIERSGTITIETLNVGPNGRSQAGPPEVAVRDYVRLSVQDDGSGMDEETLEHLFEPFYTTKALGRGTGLGLATIFGIATRNGGLVDARSVLGKGSTVSVYIPRTTRMEIDPGPAPVNGTLSGHGETVLLVEDEPALLRLGTTMLKRLGYTVLAAGGGPAAIRLVGSYAGPIDLLLTDVAMPGMSGKELAAQMRTIRPNTPCILVSGYAADLVADLDTSTADAGILQKPFTMDALAAAVQHALGRGTT